MQTEIQGKNGHGKLEPRAVTIAAPVDIFENEEEILILADFPGVARDAIQVSLEHGELVIEGRRHETKLRRTFRVPSTVDGSRAAAEVDAGVLRVRLPKRDEAKPRRIEVK